ncbi:MULTISPECIES: Gfo/Idh/MocA family protein [unclassified Curtobacterium]|uniref:Gfo/Idh/MocA family protein n=1 Tax=unclassified Curtobacterium TaxID=257496 RepID=UPI000DA718D3|nr:MULTISPECIES: Gfo/Idh/MocA family oxidoreductase [unclassified Curtobacterium]PZE28880.1 gfo/Idh/MocA family oxidoreductase [Curtobacterium sp. MCBD17_028]PZF57613.1 gfo/Idh/MocA family oxidoreductase [Curtobacterium sp. MCBD17_034]PZM33705.1 gfo/Idh/MocA family oxidoreductase [Curtobacterium sp. MCBD17_031]WIE53354.1 Gfo/Idh/MocA family oxidoreductase [Curtobacterium sp. MCBD17_003]
MFTFPEPDVPPLRGGPALRWGVIGPGEIANDFTAALHAATDQRVVAVGSRSRDRAAAFADRHGVPRAHTSYEDLVGDPEVDVVYVATPHVHHAEQALLAIRAGKHVLVEKPFTTSAADAVRVADAARAAGVLAMEAMWTRYLPQSAVLRACIDRGDLGEVHLALVDVGWPHDLGGLDRITDPALGGGALLDAGVYGLWFAQFATGAPVRIDATGRTSRSGVDLQSVAVLTGATGAQASVTTTMLASTDGLPTIAGTEGTVRFTEHFVFPAAFTLRLGDTVHAWRDRSGLRGRQGLVWQAVALAAWATEGRTDSPVHSLDDSITLMRTLDEVRRQVALART